MNSSPALRITAKDPSLATATLLAKIADDVHAKYPRGPLPPIAAPRIIADSFEPLAAPLLRDRLRTLSLTDIASP